MMKAATIVILASAWTLAAGSSLAQFKAAPAPVPIAPTIPAPMVGIPSGPDLRVPDIPKAPEVTRPLPPVLERPPAVITPSPPSYPTPIVTVPGPGGPPPGGGPPIYSPPPMPPVCVIQSTSDYASGCSTAYIHFQTLYDELHSCSTGPCYARVLSGLERLPVVVIYPAAQAVQAQAALAAEVRAGVEAMGETLRGRLAADDPGLRTDAARIDQVVADALAEADAIQQPIDETDEQRRQRLGLKRATRALVHGVLRQ